MEAQKKRRREHHFVPQFYLRRFSSDGKQINLVRVGNGDVISGAGISGQCKLRDFHGIDPHIEDAVGELENIVAPILDEIGRKDRIPVVQSASYIALVAFMINQRVRTLHSARESDKSTDFWMKLRFTGHPKLEGIDLSQFKIGTKYPVLLPMKVGAKMLPDVLGLKLAMHLIVNHSPVGFITSDNPIVAHNQYCEGAEHIGVCGWGSVGIQMFWPIDARHMILLVDPAIYKIGRKDSFVTTTSNAEDIRSLNDLQILNSDRNIYFGENVDRTVLAQRTFILREKRLAERHAIVRTEPVIEGDQACELVVTYDRMLPYRLHLSFISTRRAARRISIDARAGRFIGIKQRSSRSKSPNDRLYTVRSEPEEMP